MRILQLMSSRHYVGEAAHVVELACELRRRGHVLKLVCREDSSALTEAVSRGLDCSAAFRPRRFKPAMWWEGYKILRQVVAEFKPDLIHAHRSKEHWLAAAVIHKMTGKKPALLRTRHVMLPIRNHFANRWLFGSATQGLICVSEAVREQALMNKAVACPVMVIRGGTDVDRFESADAVACERLREALDIPPGAPVLTCLARVSPVKGQEFIVKALPEILKEFPAAVVVFAFSRDHIYRQQVCALAAELGVESQIRWVGKMDSISPLFTMSSLSLITSVESEGWSRVAVESMALGVPVVASAVGSLPEIVTPDIGIVVPHSQPSALAEAVKKLLRDEPLRRGMGEAGWKKSRSQYSLSRLADEIMACYNEVVGK